jgi:uncharacterized membrane protein YbhN (UPF0104 family)
VADGRAGRAAGADRRALGVLFLYTSAINVITLILAGIGLSLGLPGPGNPLLSLVPAAVGAIVLVLFLQLPRYVDRIVQRVPPGRLHTFLIETAASVRDTERLMFHPDWRIIGAIGYLWFDIAVLFACFAAAGQAPPLAPVVLAYQIGYPSNFIPVPGGIGVLDGSMIGMLVLYRLGGTVATAATLTYHAISLWVPAIWGTIAFIVLQKTKRQPIVLRNPREELRPRVHWFETRAATGFDRARLGRQIFSCRRSVRQLRGPPVEWDDAHRELERDLIKRLGELGDRHEVVA